MPQLEVEHVFKEFPLRGRQGSLRLLKDINLAVDSGELMVLLGPSGCGKSTLLSLAAGFALAPKDTF